MPRRAARAPVNPVLIQLFPQELRKRDLQKIRIIEAAIRCVGSEGVEELTLDAIARQLRTTRSHVAYYFRERSELRESMLRYAVAHLQDATVKRVTAERSPRARVRAMVEAAFAWARRYPEQRAVFSLFIYYGAVDEGLRRLHTEVRDSATLRIQGILQETLGTRLRARPELIWALAKEVHWVMLGGFFDAQSTGSGGTSREVETRVVAGALAVYDRAVRLLGGGPDGMSDD